jgi:hypothetical protein
MLAEDEETMQEVEDTIDYQEQLQQGRQFFDDLCLEYQGQQVLSGEDKQGAFKAILDNLTDQGALTGFGVFVFIAQRTHRNQISQIRGRKWTICGSGENLGGTFAKSRREC